MTMPAVTTSPLPPDWTQTYDLDEHAVRCRSCGRMIAVTQSTAYQRGSVFCDAWCMLEPPIARKPERNDFWLYQNAAGIPGVEIARQWGVTHPAVFLVLNRPV